MANVKERITSIRFNIYKGIKTDYYYFEEYNSKYSGVHLPCVIFDSELTIIPKRYNSLKEAINTITEGKNNVSVDFDNGCVEVTCDNEKTFTIKVLSNSGDKFSKMGEYDLLDNDKHFKKYNIYRRCEL